MIRQPGALHLHGLLAHWPEVATANWVAALLHWEEQERGRRSLERRLQDARIGRFKPLCDFDWAWPKRCDRAAVEALMAFEFLDDAGNVVLVGPNGVGKSTLAQNIGLPVVRLRRPSCRPDLRAPEPARAAAVQDARSHRRRRRVASWTAASTTAPSMQRRRRKRERRHARQAATNASFKRGFLPPLTGGSVTRPVSARRRC